MNLLNNARIYLSGPMDFVGSRVIEKYLGWRSILIPVLKALGVTTLDPWNKPTVLGHVDYGREGIGTDKSEYANNFWTNEETRARFEADFWETVHIDCRMVDIADSVIAFVPTNIYSVGTAHEIVLARMQHKPVLLISPPIRYDFFDELAAIPEAAKAALKFYGLKENPHGIPSQWYGNIVGGNNMFDGFGWENLNFKTDALYPELIDSVLAVSEPADKNSQKHSVWQDVCDFIRNHESLQNLTGGVLENLTFSEESEKELLAEAMRDPAEEMRQYFWYNKPYQPQRPLLYQLFSIASGHIPSRAQMIAHLNPSGNIEYQRYETVDDNWIIMKHC